jgi:hypothetical protein
MGNQACRDSGSTAACACVVRCPDSEVRQTLWRAARELRLRGTIDGENPDVPEGAFDALI